MPVRVGAGEVIGELATLDHRRRRNATVTGHGPIEVLVYDVATYRSLAQLDDLRSRLAPGPRRRLAEPRHRRSAAAERVDLGHLVVGQPPRRGGGVGRAPARREVAPAITDAMWGRHASHDMASSSSERSRSVGERR